MKHRKQILKQFFSIFILMMVVFSGIAANQQTAEAAGNNDISVMLDGQPVQFDVPPVVVNGRTMVPFMMIGEAMGAEVDWDQENQIITMLLGDKYIQFVVGNENMLYGNVVVDESGELVAENEASYTLEAPPVIVEDKVLAPARAIAEGFGAEVIWDQATSTVEIITGAAAQAGPESSIDMTSTPSAETVFEDNEHFQEISGRRAQDMYELGKTNFALVCFDSGDSEAKDKIATIKEAAKEANFKIYAFDKSGKRFDKPESLKFAYNAEEQEEAVHPAIFFVNYKGSGTPNVECVTEWESAGDLAEIFRKFESNELVLPSPKPETSAEPSETPEASPSPAPELSARFTKISKTQADIKYGNNDKFILVYYDSTKSDYEDSLKVIAEAVDEFGINVYYGDWERGGDTWFGNTYAGKDIPNPTVFFVYEDHAINMVKNPKDVNDLKSELRVFGFQ